MIVLRKIRECDLNLIFHWKKNCKIIKSVNVNKNITINQVEKWFQEVNDNIASECWIIESGGIKIGIINLNHMDFDENICTVECYIADEHFRNRKITPLLLYKINEYVFDKLNFEEIHCNILECDKRAINIYLKFGFEINGYFKTNIFTNEKITNIVYIKITKDIWENIKKNYAIKEKVILES